MKKTVFLLALLLSTSSAFADGFSFGFRVGGADQHINEKSAAFKTRESETKPFGSVFAGLKAGVFRIEGEYVYRFKGDYDNLGEVGMDSFMGNIYFQPPFRAQFMPYAMAGAGITKFSRKIGDKSNAFTWTIGIGLTNEISRNLFLDWGYRYVKMEKMSTTNSNVEACSFEGFAGLRFQF